MARVQHGSPWQDVAAGSNARPPSSLTVTSVTQHHQLQQIACNPPLLVDGLTSKEWLGVNGAEARGLTRGHIMESCCPRRPPFGTSADAGNILAWDEDDGLHAHATTRDQPVAVSVDTTEARRVEARLLIHIRHVQDRLDWLKSGSRKSFGHVPGDRVALLLDCSGGAVYNLGESLYRNMLKALAYDQLRHKDTILPLTCSNTASLVWKKPCHLNDSGFSDFLAWTASFGLSGECNLMDGLRKVSAFADNLDCIAIVLVNQPSQRSTLLVDYARQLVMGRDLKLHLVSINCDDSTKACLHEMAEVTCSSFHFYDTSAKDGEDVFSQDVMDLQKEQEGQYNLLHDLRQMISGKVGLDMVQQLHKVKSFSEWPSTSTIMERFGSEPRKAHLYEERPYLSSPEWLRDHSLRSQNLNIFQLLAPNSIVSRSQFVAVLQKDVAAQVHLDRMTQFTWHDGAIRHVHVDSAELHDYQCKLDVVMDTYRRRLSWLKADTRRVFGAITSQNVVFLVDTSAATEHIRTQLQEHMCQVLGEQVMFLQSFNIVSFNSEEVTSFKPKLVPATAENLEAALRWLLSWQCSGSCDLLAGLKYALEGDGLVDVDVFPFESLHVVVTGCPMQQEELLTSYLVQRLLVDAVSINTVLYTRGCEDGDVLNATSAVSSGSFLNTEDLRGYLRRVAHECNGDFHWFDCQGSVDSDDIQLIELELQRAKEFSQKAGLLKEHMDQNAERYLEEALDRRPIVTAPPQPPPPTKHIAGPPRENLSSAVRKAISAQHIASLSKKQSSTSKRGVAGNGKRPSSGRKSSATFARVPDSFYMDAGRADAAVKSTSPAMQRSANGSGRTASKIKEKYVAVRQKMTTQKWLKHRSVQALGLDLSRMVMERDFGSQHSHDVLLGKPLVRSKHCTAYPHVHVGGSTYHMRLTEEELDEYVRRIAHAILLYTGRLNFLLSGSIRVFGQILDTKICVIVDTSGSVSDHMADLQTALLQMLEDQLVAGRIRCCLLAFNSTVSTWNSELAEVTDGNRLEAESWIRRLEASGSTNMSEALKVVEGLPDIQSIYLTADGIPDRGTESVLSAVRELHEARGIPIHTVSFQSTQRDVDAFLKSVSSVTDGRFHKSAALNHAHVINAQFHALVRGSPAARRSAEADRSDAGAGPAPDFSVEGLAGQLSSVAMDGEGAGLLGAPSGSRHAVSSAGSTISSDSIHSTDVCTMPSKNLRAILRGLHGAHLKPLCSELMLANKNYILAKKYKELITNTA